jgi:hypothetical protein
MKKHRWLKILVAILIACVAAFVGLVFWILPGTYKGIEDAEILVRFAEGLIYAEPETESGVRISLLADTGGGLFLTSDCAKHCDLSPIQTPFGNRSRLPVFKPEAWIPEPTGAEKWMAVFQGEGDGMLGQRWFAGGVWTFDYPARKLILRSASFAPTAEMLRHSVPLGFRYEWGLRTANHPRFAVNIDGATVESLFDTGATVWLSDEALQILGDQGPAQRATSFVTDELFRRWHEAHPDWRVIEKGCKKSGAALIEVPEVRVSGLAAGPVWFTHRADQNLKWMSTFVDRPISASIGGNFFQHFRITVDYPNAVAYFEEVDPAVKPAGE